jgi:hypothetical protein
MTTPTHLGAGLHSDGGGAVTAGVKRAVLTAQPRKCLLQIKGAPGSPPGSATGSSGVLQLYVLCYCREDPYRGML